MTGVTRCQIARIACSGYLRLWGGMWVKKDDDGFDWALTDFLNLCVSTRDADEMFV